MASNGTTSAAAPAPVPAAGAAKENSGKEKGPELEIVIDTTTSQKQQQMPAGWPGAGGVAIFAAGPMLAGGDFHDSVAWMPPGGELPHDFKHAAGRAVQRPTQGGGGAPSRAGSRRYNDAYGEDVDGPPHAGGAAAAGGPIDPRRMGPVPMGVNVNAWNAFNAATASADGASDGGEGEDGESEDDDNNRAHHRNPQQTAMVASYGSIREQSLTDKLELYEQLLNSQDIRELEVDVLRSILLNGGRKFTIDVYEDAVHGLLAIIEQTLERMSAPPSGGQRRQEKQPEKQPPPLTAAGIQAPGPVQQQQGPPRGPPTSSNSGRPQQPQPQAPPQQAYYPPQGQQPQVSRQHPGRSRQ